MSVLQLAEKFVTSYDNFAREACPNFPRLRELSFSEGRENLIEAAKDLLWAEDKAKFQDIKAELTNDLCNTSARPLEDDWFVFRSLLVCARFSEHLEKRSTLPCTIDFNSAMKRLSPGEVYTSYREIYRWQSTSFSTAFAYQSFERRLRSNGRFVSDILAKTLLENLKQAVCRNHEKVTSDLMKHSPFQLLLSVVDSELPRTQMKVPVRQKFAHEVQRGLYLAYLLGFTVLGGLQDLGLRLRGYERNSLLEFVVDTDEMGSSWLS